MQYDPATGKQVSAVALPIKRPTACTFGALLRLACGCRIVPRARKMHSSMLTHPCRCASVAGGADLSELYVTTREEGTGAGASAHAGALLRVRVPGVRGLAAAYTFAG